MKDKFILQGKKVIRASLMQWAQWLESAGEKRFVARTELPDGSLVSTVFMGLDHNFLDYGPKHKVLIFETMVFSTESFRDVDVDRYSTWKEAEAGHKRMVTKWKRVIRSNVNYLVKEGLKINKSGKLPDKN